MSITIIVIGVYYLVARGKYGRMVFKYILRKVVLSVWTGFISQRAMACFGEPGKGYLSSKKLV